jgi:hypothetical protein
MSLVQTICAVSIDKRPVERTILRHGRAGCLHFTLTFESPPRERPTRL